MVMGSPPMQGNEKLKEPLPKSVKEVPGYLKRVIGGLFFRLDYIFKLVWETGPWILFVMLFMSVFNGVMPIIGAFIGKELLNALSNTYNISVLSATGDIDIAGTISVVGFLLIFQFAYNFVLRLVNSANGAINRINGELVVNHIKLKIIDKAKEVDISRFDVPSFYEKLENASREADRRPIQIMDSTFSIISSVISMVSFIVVLGFVSPAAPGIIILMSVPSAIINFSYRKKNVSFMRFRSKDRRQMNYFSGLITDKDAVKEIRLYGLADTFTEKYKGIFRKYFKALKKLIISEQIWQIIMTLITTAVNCVLFYYIAKKVCLGELQIGDYSLYTGALTSIASSVAAIISTTATIYEGTLFITNMIDFMDEKKTVSVLDENNALVPKHGIGHVIELRNVSFHYPESDHIILDKINLTINEGDTVVLVGLNGAGKTTLIKLITRLYDPTEGTILLDGVDIRRYEPKELYKIFGIIFQDFGRYAVSVEENISYGQVYKDKNINDIKKAAERSGADKFIEKLHEKYDTPLMRMFEENGTELSGGQWQKLAISRAFYGDSDILILDEPTAALDAIAEQEVFSQFDELRKGKTTIFVSHRLSSATIASKIVVLDGGKIAEEGTHTQLMEKKGIYHKLFTTQAKRYYESVNAEDFADNNLEKGQENADLRRTFRKPQRTTPGDR